MARTHFRTVIISPLPPTTILGRLRDAVATSITFTSLLSGVHPTLVGHVDDAGFRLTVYPTGRPPYLAVCRGTVTVEATGTLVRTRTTPTMEAVGLSIVGVIVSVACLIQLLSWATHFTSWKDFPANDGGVLLVSLLFIAWPSARFHDESAAIASAVRDAAGL